MIVLSINFIIANVVPVTTIISGLATKAGQPYPYARVWLMERRTGVIANAVRADHTGAYVFINPPASADGYIVLGFDDSQTYDPEAKDFIQPEAV